MQLFLCLYYHIRHLHRRPQLLLLLPLPRRKVVRGALPLVRQLRARKERQHLLLWVDVPLDALLIYVRQQRVIQQLLLLRAHRLYPDHRPVVLHYPLTLLR